MKVGSSGKFEKNLSCLLIYMQLNTRIDNICGSNRWSPLNQNIEKAVFCLALIRLISFGAFVPKREAI